jgi:hypothetical protein
MSRITTALKMEEPVRWILKNKDRLRFDLAIQRNEVWDINRKSLLIHSLIIYGCPLYENMLIQDNGDNYLWVIDGKQRLTTIIRYLNGEFALSDNTPNVEENEVANLKFDELSDEIRDEILNAQLTFYVLRNITKRERNNIFLRRNNYFPFSKIDLMGVLAGEDNMEFIDEILQKPFLKNIMLTDNQRNKREGRYLVAQVICLLQCGNAIDFSINSVTESMTKLEESGITEEQKNMVIELSDYLNNALPECEKFMKKVNIPMIFFTAKQAYKNGIKPEKFGGFIQQFFSAKYNKSKSEKYNEAARSATTKKDSVKTRLNEILTFYLDNEKKLPNYKKPEIKEVKSRGRRKSAVVTYNLNDEANNTKDKVENIVNNTVGNIIDNTEQEGQGGQKTDFIPYVTPESEEVQTEVVV